jgi:hypothetical protein
MYLYLINVGLAVALYVLVTAILLLAQRSVKLRSADGLRGLIVMLISVTVGYWLVLPVVLIGAEDLLPRGYDPPNWLAWTILLSPGFFSALIARKLFWLAFLATAGFIVLVNFR